MVAERGVDVLDEAGPQAARISGLPGERVDGWPGEPVPGRRGQGRIDLRGGRRWRRRALADLGQGAALDEQGIYFPARLSPRYPTVEVRVADACLDADTAVLLAGLTRALVATALAEARQHAPLPAAPARHVNAALPAAARHGLSGPAIDSFTGQPASARSVRSRLIDHLYPALSDHGDGPIITGLLRRLDQDGTGADRQRALFASGLPPPRFVQALARATLSHNM